ncbi:MAG: non-canonical purine NTP pyrophosphatase [Myxococcales bacterium]|nr:non-canonical purine NTP pyrophosphatase [Myxococcales bacterium]
MKHALLVATGNAGKLVELRALLADLPVDVLAPADVLREPKAVVEDGDTFVKNATKKARAFAEASMMLCLADDSGLEVDILGGAPGVRSARYAHERATDAENRAALLAALEAVDDPLSIRHAGATPELHRPSDRLRARFRCALVLVDPFADGAVAVSEGSAEGTILRTPRGSGGFGYDPLFVVEGADGRTMAELTSAEKNALSHRGKALAAMRPNLVAILAARTRRLAAIFA